MRRPSLALALLLGCAAADRVRAPGSERAGAADAVPRAVLVRFVEAVEGQRWQEAYPLLTARWRGRLTPSRLASDFAASGQVGRAAAERVRALLLAGAPVAVENGTATLSVGEGRSATLRLEDCGWKVDALE